MKRILHVSKYYYPFVGGVEQVARDCVNSLKSDYDQRVICFDHNARSSDSEDVVDGIPVLRVGQQLLVASQAIGRTYGRQMKRVIEEFHPDIVIFHYPNPFVAHYVLKYLPKRTRLVIYWHLDIIRQRFLRHFFSGQNLRLVGRAEKIIATSPNYIEGSRWLRSQREKCVVIPNCINEERMEVTETSATLAQNIRNTYRGKILCLAVGRHVEYKGFEYLIRAAKLLGDEYVIRITGKGPLTEDLKALAKGSDNIEFLGLVSDEELRANLQACDIFCFPSITKNEAFGVALAEAMGYGKPAVTFTIPGSGVNYVNLHEVTGLECPNRDYNAFAAAIRKLGTDSTLREEYGKNAQKRVQDHFLYSEYVENIRAVTAEAVSYDYKVCLVGSSGGHLTHLYMLEPFWREHDRFWVSFDKEDAKSMLREERFYTCFFPSNRSIKALIINTGVAWRILWKERPDLIISTGAAVAVPFFYVGKLLGAKLIYIEVFDRVNRSTLSGRFVYPVADKFIVQWEEMKRIYPKAINLGSIF